ncbi:MAG: AAA family ATPase [Candidatus Gracilibacteria bacterium]
MKIKSLSIKNFRHFDNFKLNLLNDSFNLIVGENGAGKTTIFYSLRILFDSNIFLTKFFNENDFEKGDNLIIEVILEFKKDNKNLYLFKDCINKIEENSIDILVGFYKKDLDSEGIYFGKKSFINEKSFDNIENFKINLFEIKKYIQVVYIDGTRAEQNFYTNNSFYTKVGRYLYELNKDELKLVDLNKDELKKNDIMKKIIDNSESNNFSEYLNKIILEQDEKSDNIFLDDDNNLPQSTFLSLLKLNLFKKHLDKNSTGWQYIIFAVFAIFYIKELENEIKKEGEEEKYYLILMEEPEAHLHPQMQRNLLHFIKNEFNHIEKSSLLVSTHSPNIIRAVKDIEKTIFINKNSNKSLPENLDGDIKKYINKLNIFIDINKAELLFSRGIIFVEGIAEEILIPKFFEKHIGKTLDNYGISVINVNSTDFYCYALYAESLKIPWVIITDGDITKDNTYKGETRKNNHTNIFLYNNYFIGFDTLEIDLAINNLEIIKNSISSAIGRTQLDFIVGKIKSDKSSYENKEDTNFKDKYRKFFNNLDSKSDLAYNLFENIDDTFKIPLYITNTFDSIRSKLEINSIEKEDANASKNETIKIEKKAPKNNDEISIDDVPF